MWTPHVFRTPVLMIICLSRGSSWSRMFIFENRIFIAEKLFKLCISFSTHHFQHGEASYIPLLHFSSVLGIDRVNMKFRSVSNYTLILTGLIWVGWRSIEFPSFRTRYDSNVSVDSSSSSSMSHSSR